MTGGDRATPNLDQHAEVLKLARLLRIPAKRLDFLEDVDADDVRALREQVTDQLFETNRGALQRMAGASKLLPAPVLAKIAERVFGPLLCARIAGLVEPTRAVDIAKRLPIAFLADVAAELDPRRASKIIAQIPEDSVVSIAKELVGRQDWITIGRFVGHLPDHVVSRSLSVIHNAALLQVAFVLDDKARINEILALLPDSRFDELPKAAADDELWIIAFDLIGHLDEHRQQRFAKIIGNLGPEQLNTARAKANELGVSGKLGPISAALG